MFQQDSIITVFDSSKILPVQAGDTLVGQDSSGTYRDTTTPAPVKSILSGSPTKAERITMRDLPPGNIDWITVHLVLVLALVGWLRVFGGKRLRQVIQSFFAQRNMNIMMREGNIFTERIAIALLLVYLVVMSLMVYLVTLRLVPAEQLPYQGFRLFAVVLLAVLAAWVIKNIAVTITGVIFRNQLLLSDYIPMNFIFNASIGLFLIPFVILAVYLPSEEMLYAGVGLWVIAFIYRTFRQFFIVPEYTKFSYVNRFLYLCTFEIAPILVLTKLILNELAF